MVLRNRGARLDIHNNDSKKVLENLVNKVNKNRMLPQKIFSAQCVVVGANTQTNLRQRQITSSKTNEDLPCVCAFSDMYKNIAIGIYGQVF